MAKSATGTLSGSTLDRGTSHPYQCPQSLGGRGKRTNQNGDQETEGFWVLATKKKKKTGTKKRVRKLQPFEWLILHDRLCSLLTFLAEAKASRKQVLIVRSLSGESFKVLYGGPVRLYRTRVVPNWWFALPWQASLLKITKKKMDAQAGRQLFPPED